MTDAPDLLTRIRDRLHDAPMPTEMLLDEAAAEIVRLRDMLEEEGINPDPSPPYVAPFGPPTAEDAMFFRVMVESTRSIVKNYLDIMPKVYGEGGLLRIRPPVSYTATTKEQA